MINIDFRMRTRVLGMPAVFLQALAARSPLDLRHEVVALRVEVSQRRAQRRDRLLRLAALLHPGLARAHGRVALRCDARKLRVPVPQLRDLRRS